MKIKIKKYFLATVLTLCFFISPAMSLALDWGVGVDTSKSGGISVGVGSSGSGAGNIWGGSSYGTGWSLTNPYGLPAGSISGIISNLLFWLLGIFALGGIIGFVLSGIWYLLAAGDESMADKGKEGMKYSIIGIIVGLSGFLIMQAVTMLLGGSSKKF